MPTWSCRGETIIKVILALASLILLVWDRPGIASAFNAERLLNPLPARKLSEYGIYKPGLPLYPADELVPYELVNPLFTDYALKYRYVYVPEGNPARYTPDEVLEFPIGTVLVKSFGYTPDLRKPAETPNLIETRILIHQRRGWISLVYQWDQDQTDAVLQLHGAKTDLTFVDPSGQQVELTYQIPTREQCGACHVLSGKTTPIGPKARNLNRTFIYPNGEKNQLNYWQENGYLAGLPLDLNLPQLGSIVDANFSLENRARAYLDGNCAHCHREEGAAANSELFLRWEETDPRNWGLYRAPKALGGGSGGLPYIITPGQPHQSVLWYRMQGDNPATVMPNLGRALKDREGLGLISDWISSMSP